MTARQRLGDIGSEDGRRIVAETARELGRARRATGTSQREAARRAGLSPSQYGRLERGELRRATIEDLARAARGVGLRFTVRLYPSEIRVHDAAQLALLARFEGLLAPPLRLRREVPIPIHGDLRAWDGRISAGGRTASIEAESKVADAQAVSRRIEAKARDDPDAGVIILVVNRTAHNREVLRGHREALRSQFPLDGAAITRAVRRGEVPAASGIILV